MIGSMSEPTQPQWEIVATLFDAPSAHAMLTLFERQGVPVNIVGDSPLLGEVRRCEILVPSTLVHRARWLLAQADFSDAELTFLATGELGVNDDGAAARMRDEHDLAARVSRREQHAVRGS